MLTVPSAYFVDSAVACAGCVASVDVASQCDDAFVSTIPSRNRLKISLSNSIKLKFNFRIVRQLKKPFLVTSSESTIRATSPSETPFLRAPIASATPEFRPSPPRNSHILEIPTLVHTRSSRRFVMVFVFLFYEVLANVALTLFISVNFCLSFTCVHSPSCSL